MKTYYIDETHVFKKYTSKAFNTYFGNSRICVLDIETTGLSPDNSHFVMGSLLSFESENTGRLKQYFAESLSEELALLSEYINEVSKYDVIITYNGQRFDVPFLIHRGKKLKANIDYIPFNLDIYLLLNGYSPLRKILPNLKQKTIEDYMGLWEHREDKITGKEFALMYPGNRDILMLHNKDDVLQLGRLLTALEKTDFHRGMHYLGFPVISANRKVHVQGIRFDGARLKVRGAQPAHPVDYISYGDVAGDIHIKFTKLRATFEISFPTLKKSGAEIIDLQQLPFDISPELSVLPGYESGYLILKNKGNINYLETNSFIQAFLTKAQSIIPEDFT